MIDLIKIEYKAGQPRELIDRGNILGIEYFIMNLGTHPTAYIAVPNTHPYYDKSYDELPDCNVHYGLTYSNCVLKISENERISGKWFFGWDYAHLDDYMDYPNIKYIKEGHKYTVQEIILDVLQAVHWALNALVQEALNNESN